MTYAEYLKTPEWITLRRAALRYADHKCQVCNCGGDLQVHHRKYPTVFGDEPVSDLCVLCRTCHNLFHESKRFRIPIHMTTRDLNPRSGSVDIVEIEVKKPPTKKERLDAIRSAHKRILPQS